jgi:hypothetical protein
MKDEIGAFTHFMIFKNPPSDHPPGGQGRLQNKFFRNID